MKCEEIHHFIDTYLDGELDLARHVELEQHLALCPSCQSLLEERKAFRAFFVAAVHEYKAPPQLGPKVLAAMRRVPRRFFGSMPTSSASACFPGEPNRATPESGHSRRGGAPLRPEILKMDPKEAIKGAKPAH